MKTVVKVAKESSKNMGAEANSPTSAAISSWKESLKEWASSGTLTSAIQSVLAPDAHLESLKALVSSIEKKDNSILPDVQVLAQDALRGRLGAYSSSKNTIYLSSELDTSPSIVSIVLTHELGHFIQSRVSETKDNATINNFVAALIPSAAEVFDAIRKSEPESFTASSSITLPNGETVSAQFFDTDLHNKAQRDIFDFLKYSAHARMAIAQNHVDDIDPRNQFALQFRSAAHFDNSNISGSMAMIRGWYEDALENFAKGDIQESKWSKKKKLFGLIEAGIDTGDSKWLSGKVNPAFAGENGGIELLLYRFGQICHAFQDFYTHSNWLALVGDGRRQPLPSGSILDAGLGLPTILKPGDALPGVKEGMTALIATKGADWTKMLKLAGRGGRYVYGSDQDVYWNAISDSSSKSDGGAKIFGLDDPSMFAETRVGNKTVYGLATGATWGLLYPDEDLSLKFRDPFKEGSLVSLEYFEGFDHGGLAGTEYPVKHPITQKKLNKYLGPLSKDTEKSFGFDNAMAYANKQIKNEWDRLGNLIYKQFGTAGLERFANYALERPDEQKKYVETYSKPGARWAWADPLSYFTIEVTSPETFGEFSGAELRFVNIAVKSSSNPTGQELVTGLQYKSVGGTWVDSAFTDLSSLHRHGEIPDDTWRKILIPSTVRHSNSGGRAYWLEYNPSEHEGGGLSYVVEADNLDLRIFISNFDPTRDRVVLVDSNGEQLSVFNGNWSPKEYQNDRQVLLEKYNVDLDASPIALMDRQSFVIEKSKIPLANGFSSGLALSASELFVDYDASFSSGTNQLVFASYDNSLPFLRLVDGELVASADLGNYAGQTYSALVSVSDGSSVLSDQVISIAVAPSLTTGKGDAITPGQKYQLQFMSQDESYYSILEAIDEDNNQPGIDRISVLASLTGNAGGNPVGWDPLNQVVRIGTAAESGTLTFWLKKQESEAPIKLSSTLNSKNGYDLSLGETLIARLSAVSETTKQGAIPFEMESFSVADSSADVTGFVLYKDVDKFKLDFVTNGSAAYSSRLGFVMTDIRTGDLIDPVTGHHIETSIDNFASNIASYALFETKVAQGENLPGSVELDIAQAVDTRNIVFTPFIKTDTGSIQRLYSGNPLMNADGLEHVIKVGGMALGVEDMFGRTAGDYNDIMFSITGVSQL